MLGIGKFGIVFGALSLASTAAFALPKASELVAPMGMGYNIGNTMEVPENPTGWGNPLPTAGYIKAIERDFEYVLTTSRLSYFLISSRHVLPPKSI